MRSTDTGKENSNTSTWWIKLKRKYIYFAILEIMPDTEKLQCIRNIIIINNCHFTSVLSPLSMDSYRAKYTQEIEGDFIPSLATGG